MKKITIMTRWMTALMLALITVLSAGCNISLLPAETEQIASVQKQPESTEPPTEEITEPLTEAPTEAPTEPQVVVPEELTAMLENSGYTAEDLSERECTQLITVASSGNTCQLRYYYYENYAWICDEALSCSGFVGKNGVTEYKREGDFKTPAGLYSVGEAFHIYDAPATGLNVFQITQDTYWVDDPDSKYYNQRVEGTENKDWNSAEHMIGYNPAYIYGFVINYNMESVYNMGSAIFFHISTGGGTAGCVSADEGYVLQYLALLDKAYNPHILIQ